MPNIKLTDQANSSDVLNRDENVVRLSETQAQDVSINISADDVVSMRQVGNDLTIELQNGEVIVLEGYYVDLPGAAQHRLFVSEGGEIAQLLAGDNAVAASVNSELIFGGEAGVAAFGGLSGGVLAAGVVGIGSAIALAGSGGGDGEPTPPWGPAGTPFKAEELFVGAAPRATGTLLYHLGIVFGSVAEIGRAHP